MIRFRVTCSATGGAVHVMFVLATTDRAARSKAADMTPNFRRILRVTK
jgi:hypothetical protein